MFTDRVLTGWNAEFQYTKDGVTTKRTGVLMPNAKTLSDDTHVTIHPDGEEHPKAFRRTGIKFFSYVI
jgi:hypothetical protein